MVHRLYLMGESLKKKTWEKGWGGGEDTDSQIAELGQETFAT